MLIDSHHHLWKYSPEEYGWIDDQMSVLQRDFQAAELRQIAADFAVPLWEYDTVAGTMNGRGLDIDGVHMTTYYAHDHTSPEAYTRGHAMHNLTALMVLDTLWKEVILAATE